jgi:hypothetical protein
MHRSARLFRCVAAAAAAAIAAVGFAVAQEKETIVKGQTKIGLHTVKMEKGKLYQVRVEAEGWRPSVQLRRANFVNTSYLDENETFQGYVMPEDSRDFRISILPQADDDIVGDLLNYKLVVKHIPLDDKPVRSEKSELVASDPAYKEDGGFQRFQHHRPFNVRLKARHIYVIDMVAPEGVRDFDPVVALEGPSGKVVAQDDDGGEGSNARIVYQSKRGGDYKIVAGALGKGIGPFTISLRVEVRGE